MAENNYITHNEESGSVSISEDVIATIAYETVREIEGVGGFATSFGGELAERFSKSKKTSSRSVKITIAENTITVDVFILVKYGIVISEVAQAVQESVRSAVEAMIGLSVAAVNVTICGIVFEKTK